MTCTNPYTSVSVSGYNSAPPPDDGTTGTNNLVTWSTHKDKIGDPLKTAVEAINTNINSAFDSLVSCINNYHGSVMVGAYLSSNQTVSANTKTKITFDTEEFDAGNDFATGTFTAPATGKYLVSTGLQVDSMSDGLQIEAYIYVNGSEHKTLQRDDSPKASNTMVVGGSCIVEASSGQSIEIYGLIGGNTDFIGAQTSSWVTITRIA